MAEFPSHAREVIITTNAHTDRVSPWLRRRMVPVRSGSIATAEGFLDCNETGGIVCATLGYPTNSTTTLYSPPTTKPSKLLKTTRKSQ